MKYDKEGLKYFMFLCSKNIDNKYYMILPEEIKFLIWNIIHFKPFIQCVICNKILLNIIIDIRDEYNTENFIQHNGEIRCVDC
tara:strand:+ start:4229 stop:4477 length:249 start_codon:yes stop_codon:yes gene_type:complete